MHHLTGEGDGLCGVSPDLWPVVVGAHRLQDGGSASFFAVLKLAPASCAEGTNEAVVDNGSSGYPFVVGAWKPVREVYPCPHYQGTRGGEDGGVSEIGDGGVELGILAES